MTKISQLPPLILHPFNAESGSDTLLDASRAKLAMRGLTEFGETNPDMHRRIIAGCYEEIRMLLFLGKDVWRWLGQCVEYLEHTPDEHTGILEQSFATLIVDEPPEPVKRKLERWGVNERRAIFSRAIGIYSLFQNPPAPESLSPVFLYNYQRFADHAYICFQHLRAFRQLDPKKFHFELYASDEYARLLSDQWERA